MKRLMGVLIALLLAAFIATPVFADDGRGDHLCVAGDTLVRSGETPDNVVLFGCGARIEKGVRVTRDVVAFGGDVVLEEGTRVGRSVVIFGGDVQIAGQVDQEITVFGGRITLEPTAVIERDILVFGGSIDQKEGATVKGQVLRNGGGAFPRVRINPPIPPIPPVPPFRSNDWSFWNLLAGFLQSFVVTLGLGALGALIIVFLPNQFKQVGDVAQQSALPSLGVGCLTWLVVPPLMILFVLTCLGIPLAAVLGILFVAAGVFGWIAIGMILGDRLLNALKVKTSVPLVAMAVGLLILWLVTAIPFLGWLIWLFVAALAVGAVVLTRFGTRAYPPVATAPTMIASVAPVTPSAPASLGDAGPSI